MRATAAVLEAYDSPFEVADVEVDDPRAGEVLVRVVATGICHTDGLAQHADLPFPTPGVLGHEGAGVVEAVGAGVATIEPGAKVIMGWPWCGACRACLAGQPRYCAQIGPLLAGGGRTDGTTSIRRGGEPLHSHFFGQSSFSTYSIVQASSLVTVAADAPIERYGPLACGIGTGAGAVLNVLRPTLGSSIVVYGTGAVGLAAVMAAGCSGATTIIGVDLHDERLQLATRFGATHTINARTTDPVAAVAEICGGLADYSLECTGSMSVVRQAIDSVGMRGTAALIGGGPAGASFEADHLSTLWGKRIVGILGGEGTSPQLIGSLLDLHAQGRFPFDELIVEFDLAQINEALAASYAGDVLKPVLRMPA